MGPSCICVDCEAATTLTEQFRLFNLRTRIRYGQTLTTEETAQLRKRLKAAEKTKWSIGTSPSCKLRKSLDEIKPELLTLMHEARSLLSPVHRLPTEILVEIFKNHDNFIRISKDSYIGPFSLTGICHRWRQVALSTSSLWSRITISIQNNTGADSEVGLAQFVITHSATHPLNIAIVGDVDSEPWPVDLESHRVIELFLKESFRWQQLMVGLPLKLLRCVFSSIRGKLPIMETLCFFCRELIDTPFETFDQAPCLKHVVIAVPGAEMLSLPWAQITDINYSNYGAEIFAYLLTKCPGAVTTSLRNLFVYPENRDADYIQSPISSFEYILRDNTDDRALSYLCKSLVVPNLKTFKAVGPRNTDPDTPITCVFPSLIPSMISRSGCAIKVLHLKYLRISQESLLQVLRFTPSLLSLTYVEYRHYDPNNPPPIDDHFMKQLTIPPTPAFKSGEVKMDILLPCLERLNFRPCGKMLEESSVIAMIISRRKTYPIGDNGAHTNIMKRVEWRSIKPISKETRKKLRELAEEGLSVKTWNHESVFEQGPHYVKEF